MIGRGQVEIQHPEDRRQEALSLPQGQVEDEPERQRGFDGEIGILPLPSTRANAHGLPGGDRIRGQPHGDIPRWTSARSYADQFPTWYFVLYFGCTLDFMSRSCACRRYDGQDVERGSLRARDPCTNAAKHGRRGRRGWKKLHLGVDQAGVIVAQALTDSAVDDASTGLDLIETIASSARTVTADAAYDTLAFYETANTRGTTVVVPPAKTATLSRRNPQSSARDGTIRRISKIGRRRWKKEVGYHRQARVENAFFRYKSILGDRLRSRTRAAQAVESVLACNVLNRMTELGRPESCAIDR